MIDWLDKINHKSMHIYDVNHYTLFSEITEITL